MKMKSEHYDLLDEKITHYLKGHPSVTVEDHIRRGWTARRWRWDVMWASITTHGQSDKLMFFLYGYLNDSHIDTALRKITKTK